MKFKVFLPDKSELTFDDKESAYKAAKEAAARNNKVIKVSVTHNGFDWEQLALVYPTGMVQEGTGGFGFFKRLSTSGKK